MQPLAGERIKQPMQRAPLVQPPERERARGAGGASKANGSLHELIEGLASDSRKLDARFQALEAIADLLRAEVEASAQRLRQLITELEMAEERLERGGPAVAPLAANGGERTPRRPLHSHRVEDAATAPRSRLGAREREVLKLLTDGLRSPCIAERLGITTGTVEAHRRNIMRKLNLHSVAALTKYALRVGLTSL